MSAKKATDTEVVEAVIKTRGRVKNAADMLGMSHGALSQRLQKPEVKNALQSIIDQCLKDAKITTRKVYSQLGRQLAAGGKKPNWKAQDSARKDALKLMGHLDNSEEKDKGASGQIVVMPIVVVEGKPLQFKVGSNA